MRVNLQNNLKLKHDPKIHGSKRFKATLNHEGDQNLKNLGKTITAATIGNYLVNLDLWTNIPWVIDCLTTNELIEFFQLSGFLKWKKDVPLIINDSPIWKSGNQDF